MDGQKIDRQTEKPTVRQTNSQTDKTEKQLTDGWTIYRQTGKQKVQIDDEQPNRQQPTYRPNIDRQTKKQIVKQTYICTDKRKKR